MKFYFIFLLTYLWKWQPWNNYFEKILGTKDTISKLVDKGYVTADTKTLCNNRKWMRKLTDKTKKGSRLSPEIDSSKLLFCQLMGNIFIKKSEIYKVTKKMKVKSLEGHMKKVLSPKTWLSITLHYDYFDFVHCKS